MTNTFQSIAGRTASVLDLCAIADALAHHEVDENHQALTFVCVDCGTIGMCAAASQRDLLVEHFDFTCCSADDTFVAITRTI